MRLLVYDMLVNVNDIYYVHVCEQARWVRSAGNSAIENLCIIIYFIWMLDSGLESLCIPRVQKCHMWVRSNWAFEAVTGAQRWTLYVLKLRFICTHRTPIPAVIYYASDHVRIDDLRKSWGLHSVSAYGCIAELRSCVKVEVAVLGSRS